MRVLPFLILLLISSNSWAWKDGINDTIRVRGTRVTLVPGPEFALAKDGVTLQYPAVKDAYFLFTDYLWSYKQIRTSYTLQTYQNKGLKNISLKDTMINGRNAMKLFGEEPDSNGNTYGKPLFLLDFENATVKVVGSFPTSHSQIKTALDRLISSIGYNTNTNLNLIKELDFSIDTSGLGFRYKPGQSGGKQLLLIPHDLTQFGQQPDCYFWTAQFEFYPDPKMPMTLEERFKREATSQCKEYNVSPSGNPTSITKGDLSGFQWSTLR